MKRLSKQAYTKQRKAWEARKRQIEQLISDLPHASGAITAIADENKEHADGYEAEHWWDIQNSIGGAYDAMHDLVELIDREIKHLDDAWERRDWSPTDYASYELVMQNID
jgi:hypothetical protein